MSALLQICQTSDRGEGSIIRHCHRYIDSDMHSKLKAIKCLLNDTSSICVPLTQNCVTVVIRIACWLVIGHMRQFGRNCCHTHRLLTCDWSELCNCCHTHRFLTCDWSELCNYCHTHRLLTCDWSKLCNCCHTHRLLTCDWSEWCNCCHTHAC